MAMVQLETKNVCSDPRGPIQSWDPLIPDPSIHQSGWSKAVYFYTNLTLLLVVLISMRLKNEATLWLKNLHAGTINGAIDCNPTAAVRFFGSLPVIRRDRKSTSPGF